MKKGDRVEVIDLLEIDSKWYNVKVGDTGVILHIDPHFAMVDFGRNIHKAGLYPTTKKLCFLHRIREVKQ